MMTLDVEQGAGFFTAQHFLNFQLSALNKQRIVTTVRR